jgi:SpoVK/Ycf46/Vps4 family AAA+-type ATPase
VLTATGRFGTELRLRLPDFSDRTKLFTRYLSKGRVCCKGEMESAARHSEGLSCADIEEVCRREILRAARASLEKNPDAGGEVQISIEEDVLKALDRWRLTETRTVHEGIPG